MNLLTRCAAAAAILVSSALLVSGCGQATASSAKSVQPASVEQIGDSGIKKLTLTDKAVSRLGITTAMVAEQAPANSAGGRLVIPYAALLYLPDGDTFAYTNPEGTSYVRESVTVESIVGDKAVLTAGPPIGTAVVTTGGAELWGLEFGIK